MCRPWIISHAKQGRERLDAIFYIVLFLVIGIVYLLLFLPTPAPPPTKENPLALEIRHLRMAREAETIAIGMLSAAIQDLTKALNDGRLLPVMPIKPERIER
ncbi:MAG: hypothetical protein ABIH23_08335 [bacterium]